MMRFRIRILSGPYKGQYFARPGFGLVWSKEDAFIYKKLPPTFHKSLHRLELVL